jgi:hypothetical protein
MNNMFISMPTNWQVERDNYLWTWTNDVEDIVSKKLTKIGK